MDEDKLRKDTEARLEVLKRNGVRLSDEDLAVILGVQREEVESGKYIGLGTKPSEPYLDFNEGFDFLVKDEEAAWATYTLIKRTPKSKTNVSLGVVEVHGPDVMIHGTGRVSHHGSSNSTDSHVQPGRKIVNFEHGIKMSVRMNLRYIGDPTMETSLISKHSSRSSSGLLDGGSQLLSQKRCHSATSLTHSQSIRKAETQDFENKNRMETLIEATGKSTAAVKKASAHLGHLGSGVGTSLTSHASGFTSKAAGLAKHLPSVYHPARN
jgi:hypothetical protein